MKRYLIDTCDVAVSTYMGETVTKAYNRLGTDVKDDYYHNRFDGNISWVFFYNNVMVGCVLAKDMSDKCFIYGYSACNDEVRESIFQQFVALVRLTSKHKAGRRFKGKYSSIYVKCDSNDDRSLCARLGFKYAAETDTYVLELR